MDGGPLFEREKFFLQNFSACRLMATKGAHSNRASMTAKAEGERKLAATEATGPGKRWKL